MAAQTKKKTIFERFLAVFQKPEAQAGPSQFQKDMKLSKEERAKKVVKGFNKKMNQPDK